jgi:hypothetical protein
VNRFNLTFSGELLTGKDPAEVKLGFGKMFAIDDPVRLERFFSGQTIILRRNLERKEAAKYYHELHMLGAVAALVKVSTSERADAIANQSQELQVASTNSARTAPAAATKPVTRRKKVHKTVKGKLQKTPDKSRRDIAAGIKSRKEESLQQAQQAADQKSMEDAQRKAQEAARLQAEIEETKRREAEKAARLKAEREEKQRREAEDAARLKAEREEKRHREAEKAARLKAEHEEKQRREAEEAARLKAERQEKQRREAEKAAQLKAELDELRRLEAEETSRLQAELEEIRRQESEAAAQLQAELKAVEQQAAAEAARIKIESQRKLDEAERKSNERRRATAMSLSAQRTLHGKENHSTVETHAVPPQPEPNNVPQQTSKSAKSRVKTTLDVPQRLQNSSAGADAATQRKRQAGEPNLYKLRPFRNSEEVRNRSSLAQQRKRQSYTFAALALALILLAGWGALQQSDNPAITGADAIAIDPQAGPVLLVGNTLLRHDRSGTSTSETDGNAIGISALEAPLAFDRTGALLALGTLTADGKESMDDIRMRLLRCEPGLEACAAISSDLNNVNVSAFVINPVDGSLILTDTPAGELLKVDSAGKVLHRASITVPEHPVLRLHSGLLLMNNADAPAISVFRYEDNAFGQQLDEILLVPPAAQTAGQSIVSDFIWSGSAWWVSLQDPQTGNIGLYRFDEEWNFLNTVSLPSADPIQLTGWGEKTLVNNPNSAEIQRFNAEGIIEAPFISTPLEMLVNQQQQHARFVTMSWRIVLLVCALGMIAGVCFGYLQGLRKLVYTPRRERGAEPLDDYIDTLHWIEPINNRQALLRRRGYSYGLLALAALLLAAGQSVSAWQLGALLLALSGPVIALLLLGRSSAGHIGVWQDRLLLVDHSELYHFSGGSSVQYRGPFLLIDDVVVFCGNRLLPAFTAAEIEKWVRPLTNSGVKVDRSTLAVKLLQSHHPLAQGALAIVFTGVTAVLMLGLNGLL